MRWLIALLLLSGIALAQSQQPSPPKPQSKSGSLGEQKPAPQPTPSVNHLIPEQIKKAITDGIDAAAKKYEDRHPATPPDNSGWYFNLLLTVFTGGLVVVGGVQCFLIFWTLKATQKAAKAAQTAAEAIQIIERPYIFIWGIVGSAPTITYSSSCGDFPEQIISKKASFIYSVSNRGKLAAVIENVSIAWGYKMGERYPPLIIIGDHKLLQTPILSSDEDVENIVFDIPWRDLDRTTLTPSPEFRDGLIFRVIIAYRGPLTKGHETSQCWRYNKSLNGFSEVADASYTYSR